MYVRAHFNALELDPKRQKKEYVSCTHEGINSCSKVRSNFQGCREHMLWSQ